MNIKTIARTLAAWLLLASLAGCANAPSPHNRLTCAKAKDAAFFNVMFASIGFAFRVAAADAKSACEDPPKPAAAAPASAPVETPVASPLKAAQKPA